MKTYNVVRLDDELKEPRAALFMGADGNPAEVENGTFVTLHELVEGEREVYTAKAVAEGDTNVGVVCTVPFSYDERGYHGVETFPPNEAGVKIRVALLTDKQRFSLAGKDISYTKGTEVSVGAKKLNCIEIENAGKLKFYVLEVQ